MQLCNYMELYANLCNNATYATICNYMQIYATMQLMQLYATILKLYATICNYASTTNIYSYDNLSSCFNECRYHQIGICQIYIPQVMIKIY
jgi:hypothetical protein